MTKKGMFITFEGGEGGGKSTQVRLLHAALAAAGVDAITTREPGGTPEAENIRNLLVQRDGGHYDPMTEVLLLFAGRREHVDKKIRPALSKGQWVICDRFADSTRAMQGDGMGVAQSAIEQVYAMTVGDLKPDLTIILDIDPAAGLARAHKKLQGLGSTEDRYERMDMDFHRRLRMGFLRIAEQEPQRCIVIDAAQDETAVHAAIFAAVQKKFSLQIAERKHG